MLPFLLSPSQKGLALFLCLPFRFRTLGMLAEPVVYRAFVEPPALAHLLARQPAVLNQLVQRRLGNLQILRQGIDGQDVV